MLGLVILLGLSPLVDPFSQPILEPHSCPKGGLPIMVINNFYIKLIYVKTLGEMFPFFDRSKINY